MTDMEDVEYGRLRCIGGKHDGATFPLSGELTVGRSADANLRIKLDTVSRKHATIALNENGQVRQRLACSAAIANCN
jgi:pSer/pThr/pTyr-binding forkhead associated (FHA) protein